MAGYNTDPSRGADTFVPFKKGPEIISFAIGGYRDRGKQEIFRMPVAGVKKVEFTYQKIQQTGNTILNVNGKSYTMTKTIGKVHSYSITATDDISITLNDLIYMEAIFSLYYK